MRRALGVIALSIAVAVGIGWWRASADPGGADGQTRGAVVGGAATSGAGPAAPTPVGAPSAAARAAAIVVGAAREAADAADGQPLTEDEANAAVLAANDAFEAGDLPTALAGFQRVVDLGPDAKLAPYALYKLAWCHRNAGQDREAIADLELLLSWGATQTGPSWDPLVTEARADLATFRAAAPAR